MLLDGLHLEQVLHMTQLDDISLGGHVELSLTVHGPAEDAEIIGEFLIDEPQYGAMELTRVEGRVDYANRRAAFEIDGWDGTRAALHAAGETPVDLGFVGVEDRIPDGPLDVTISADSLDAAIALSYVTTLEQVAGVVSGDVHIGGTTAEPEPDGALTLRDGAWSIEAIGVRHERVDGDLRLLPDRTVEVDVATGTTGRSEVHGVVLLAPLRDPALDLTFSFDGFPAVVRPDIEGLISGEFVLSGTYRRPLAQGDLTVDESTVYVDEIRRAAEVVDLRDPFLFQSGITVDTTALINQPLIAGLRNPFFDNLRVNVNLSVPSDTWLRSIETDVEIGGDLLVRYDRPAGDFVLIGELQALRGTHLVLGRTFEIDGGTVGFIGRPGMNPSLDIQASSRIRRFDEQPLEIQAQVEGTLVRPLVTLSTDEAGLGQSDLVSYLVFGQSTSQVGGRGQVLGDFGAASSAYAVTQGVVSYVGGRLVNQFGSALGRGLGLDYVSIETGGRGSLEGGYLLDTQIEFGQYVSDDVFVVIVWRPTQSGAQEQNNLAGARVEWAFTDDYTFEAFREDRFLRSGSPFGASGLQGDESIWGVFFFREWGY
jgi:translocation and assembly module TamB